MTGTTGIAAELSAFAVQEQAELAAAVAAITEAAGAEILRIYGQDFDYRHKEDRSPVTAADEIAEALILEHLACLTPDIPVVAEESVAGGRVPVVGEGPFWLVDPLDGTREFISRNGEFTVNVALIEHHRPLLGAVHVPAKDITYRAAGPGMALRRAGNETQAIAVRRPGPDGLVVVASRSHRDAETDAYLARLRVKSFTAAGSSLKFCLLAEGSADFYPRFGRTMEWDTAAGHAVLAAAGGSVRTLEETELRYGKQGFANPSFLAYGGGVEGR